MNENDKKFSQFRAALEARGDGKCYCPCFDYRSLQRRRLLITTTERHCTEKGHVKGGYEYPPLVRGYSIVVS
jgi:hypothetical protein